ncbi:MAG: pyridoxamine 5'-phosphate oxidase family protein [Acidimicrobiia bacterium]|nr:pyridoxamine 5'-phosphate oxidase family protein [Acidimicrobiia bacterium]
MPLPTSSDEIWAHIERWPFAVLGFVTPSGEARAAGVMYRVRHRRLYIITGPDTWKARHISRNPHVSVTVTVQRVPIRIRQAPPAVITFSGRAAVLPIESVDPDLRAQLLRGVGDDIGPSCVIEIEPVGRFVTYGIGINPMQMRHPDKALARVPVG